MIRIEPYKDEEVNDILKKLLANTEFLSFVEKNLNNKESKFLSLPGSKFLAMQLFKGKIKNIHTVDDFQNQMKKVLSSVIDKTIENSLIVVLRSLIKQNHIYLLETTEILPLTLLYATTQ